LDPLLAGLFIFVLRIADVSMAIVRLLVVIRGLKGLAWVFGFVQAFVYIVAIRQIMSDLGNWINILAYAAGFATGNVVGILLEERLAIGFAHVRIVSPRLGSSLMARLHEAGYGVTVLSGRGKDGMVDILFTTVNRRHVGAVSRLVEETDPGAFITVESVRPLRMGFF
jgi:uncharacterized protein YebE (UPF0316 family)